MILYDKGDPIAALRVLGPWLKQCHIKDATKTKMPGTWGEEVVGRHGAGGLARIFPNRRQLDFKGNFAIEREAGEQRVADIRAARIIFPTRQMNSGAINLTTTFTQFFLK